MANLAITNSTGMGAGNVQQNLTTTYKSLAVFGNSSATTATNGAGLYRRGKILGFEVGTNGTPADNYIEYDITRITLGTTPTGITGTLISSLSSNFALDPADNTGCVNALHINSTAEIGIAATTELWLLGLNQRVSYRWVAMPGNEMVWPAVSSATASGGLALRARSSLYTSTITARVEFQEQ